VSLPRYLFLILIWSFVRLWQSWFPLNFKIVWPWIVDSLWIKPTDALSSNSIGITTLHVSGSLSAHHQEFLAVAPALVQFMQFGYRVLPGEGWNCSSILQHSVTKLHKLYQCWCMAKNSWWWAERLPETCRVVIPIELELSASVGFIHKVSNNFVVTWLKIY
jgi:hypothetical protein